jgi:hypothetical protein
MHRKAILPQHDKSYQRMRGATIHMKEATPQKVIVLLK